MNKNLLKISFFTIMFLALASLTVSSFAFWDKLSDDSKQSITLGDGVKLDFTQVVAVGDGKNLVPVGAVLTANDVEEVKYTYTVNLDKEVIENLDLSVAIIDKKFIDQNGIESTLYTDLISITVIQDSLTIDGTSPVDVTVIITLSKPNGPDAKEIYQKIKNNAIKFSISIQANKKF